jgi:hypothetical protein
MYACTVKPSADFSRGCALPATRPRIFATHPHRQLLRESCGPMSPYAQHVDHHDKPYLKPDHAPSKRRT